MELLAITQTAVQSLQEMTTKSDNTAIITSIVQTGIFAFLVGWIYKVFDKMNNFLVNKVDMLEKKVKELEVNENKWFRNYHKLRVLIVKNSCKPNCKVKDALDELLSKEGETNNEEKE